MVMENQDYIEQLKWKIHQSKGIQELEEVRYEISRTIENADLRGELLAIVDEMIVSQRKENARLGTAVLRDEIFRCVTLQDALNISMKIKNGGFPHREEYELKRVLRENISRKMWETIQVCKKIRKAKIRESASNAGYGLIGIGIMILVRLFVENDFILTCLKWGLILGAIGEAYWVFATIGQAFTWLFSSKEKKQAAKLVDIMEKNELYFDPDDYIIPDSDVRYLQETELPKDLRGRYLARLEIYARHGEKYDSDLEEEEDYFEQKSWYKHTPRRNVNAKDYNKYEVYNHNLLLSDGEKGMQLTYIE